MQFEFEVYRTACYIALLTCACLLGSAAWAQNSDPCNGLVQATERLRLKENKTPDDYQAVVTNAREGRTCYGESNIRRVVWLLNKETWALDYLGEHNDARAY